MRLTLMDGDRRIEVSTQQEVARALSSFGIEAYNTAGEKISLEEVLALPAVALFSESVDDTVQRIFTHDEIMKILSEHGIQSESAAGYLTNLKPVEPMAFLSGPLPGGEEIPLLAVGDAKIAKIVRDNETYYVEFVEDLLARQALMEDLIGGPQ